MPCIAVKVNVPVQKEQELALKAALGKAVELLPGKSESWLMVSLEDNCRLYFKGSPDPAAFTEVKLYGKAGAEAYDRLTKEITALLQKELGIPPARCYVEYEETEHWGWNGGNF